MKVTPQGAGLVAAHVLLPAMLAVAVKVLAVPAYSTVPYYYAGALWGTPNPTWQPHR